MSITSNPTFLPASAYLSWVEVDLAAIRHNYRLVRNHVPPDIALFPVVKADAYGHGALHVVKELQKEGADRVCVARVEEALELRNAGIEIKILVFTPPLPPQAEVAARYGLEVVVCDPAHVKAIAAAVATTGGQSPVHIKTDVGMGRIGSAPGEVPALFRQCIDAGLNVRGIMSHFPCADAPDTAITESMAEIFHSVRRAIPADQAANLFFHVSNTAATLRFPDAYHNAVRSGISIYGQYPSYDMERILPLRPAMALKTRIVYVKEVAADTPISYCGTYRTPHPSRIATLALGYADGYPRHASNRTRFLVRGCLAPQVGRVCMDQLMIDVTNVPGASIGDEVLAFGRSQDGELLAEEVAAKFDSLGYELTSRIGKRLPRFYVQNDFQQDTESSKPITVAPDKS